MPRLALVAGFAVLLLTFAFPAQVLAVNPIVTENLQTGNPASEWDLDGGVGDTSIEGFATDISVNQGETVHFKIKTNATAYRIDIYRLGYYAGMGARKVATVSPSATLPQSQPDFTYEDATGLIDCGNWAESARWNVPADAVSGIYIAKLVSEDIDNPGANHMAFIVRDDASHADIYLQTSDATWQAYNSWGGNSLYNGNPAGRAYKVSYNRPFTTRKDDGGLRRADWVFNADYPMVRWLEANGYDVSYTTCVDIDRRGPLITQHKIYISVGHDEYWSAAQRANVEDARNAGVNLAFFSGNEIFWKTRYEPHDSSGVLIPYRTLVCYKDTHAGAKIDPLPNMWTGTWRDPRFSPPADGGRPENALSGTIFYINGYTNDALIATAEYGDLRFWRNTAVAALSPGGSINFGNGTLGFEWDEDRDNGARPPGLIRLSSTSHVVAGYLQDYGSTYAQGLATHHLVLYRQPGGGLVFGAGTVQWAWGLDSDHDAYWGWRGDSPGLLAQPAMQQATMNMFADMGNVQPATRQLGLVAATMTFDVTGPTTVVTFPTAGTHVQSGAPVAVTGTATDVGGVVGGIEVSADGGLTWHPATGRASWTYDWTPGAIGTATLKCRAIDDSGNLESPAGSVTVVVDTRTCPCPIWSAATPPAMIETDTNAWELGLKFRSDVDGFVTGLRFYKGAAMPLAARAASGDLWNTCGAQNAEAMWCPVDAQTSAKEAAKANVRIGHLWSSTGTMLAEATFTETASGWQEVTLPIPVPISVNTVYVASYHTDVGRFAYTRSYFATAGYDSAPLHALKDNGPLDGNGVYAAGGIAFPTETYLSSNYWVDVVFASSIGSDTTPPTVVAQAPEPGATAVPVSTTVTVQFSESVQPGSIVFELRNSNNQLAPAAVTYDAGTRTATLTPTANLVPTLTYTARVSVAEDLAGNYMMDPVTWSFTTTATPCFVDLAASDFAQGTFNQTYLSQTTDGEVSLAPAEGAEFTGTSLPADWDSHIWKPGGSVTISGGKLQLHAARVNTDTLSFFGSGRSLEFVATFAPLPTGWQHGGFGITFNEIAPNCHSAKFTTWDGLNFFAESEVGSQQIFTPLGTGLLGSPHRYRVEWLAGTVNYYVDGSLVASHAITIGGTMRPVFSDYTVGGPALTVDWARLTPYTDSGTYLSRVYTAGGPVAWREVAWTADVPAGTSLALSVRTGSTPEPGSGWSDFIPLDAPGASVGTTAQYVQYRADLARVPGESGPPDPILTPVLRDVSFACADDQDVTPPAIYSRSPAPGATGVATTATVSVQFSEVMDMSTVTTSSLRLRASGAPADVPATVGYAGLTATLTPLGALSVGTLYQVTVDGSVADLAHNPLGSPQTWTFRTLASGTVFETTVADFSDGTRSGTQVVPLGDGAVTLSGFSFSDGFTQADGPANNWQPWVASDYSATPTWQVLSGVYVHDLNSATPNYHPSILAAGSTPSGDFDLSARVRITQVGSNGADAGVFGFVFGAGSQASAPYYLLQWCRPIGSTVLGLGIKRKLQDPTRDWTYLASNAATPPPVIGQWYVLRMVTSGTQVKVYVDDVLQLTAGLSGYVPGRIGLLAYSGCRSEYDDVVVTTSSGYAASGTYQSNVFDAGTPVDWQAMSWTSDLPAGTTLGMTAGTGNSLPPDGSWTVAPILSGSLIGRQSRYLQYHAALATTSSLASPALRDVTMNYDVRISETTATALESNPNPSVVLGAVTLTARVTPPSATGTVTFRDGLGDLDTRPLMAGVATMTTSSLTEGTHTLTAQYNGDPGFEASVSATLSQVITAPSSTVSVGPVVGMITNATPTVRIPVRITRNSETPDLRAYKVTFSVTGSLKAASGLGGIAEGSYLGADGGTTTFLKRRPGSGVYEVSGALLGSPCGADSLFGTLFYVTVTDSLASGSGTVAISEVLLRDCGNESMLAVIGSAATVLVDRSSPTVAVVTPNGGESWTVGSLQTITWTASDNEGVTLNGIDIDYSANNGTSWTAVATGEANDGTFTWTVPNAPTATALVRVTAHDVNGNTGSDASNARFTIAYPPVGAIADLAAVQMRAGNAADSTTGVTLTWTTPPGDATVEVWRKGFGRYPEYDDSLGAVVPTASATYLPGPGPGAGPGAGWTKTAVTASGGNDLWSTRGFYYYVAYVKDGYGTWSPASAVTGGTLNYHLGDVSNGLHAGTGNNSVFTEDISLLGAHYGAALGVNDPFGYLDVGPTSDGWIDGRPLTDNRVEFEDLVMFGLNYDAVSKGNPRPAAATNDMLVLEVPALVRAGETVEARIRMRGTGQVFGLSVALAWDPAKVTLLSVTPGDLASANAAVLLSSAPGVVDATVLGIQSGGITGDGELAVFRFRVLAPGASGITVDAVKARDARNRGVTLPFTTTLVAGAPPPPSVTQLSPAQPNPFSRTSTISFSLAEAGAIDLAVYAVSGARVRTLARGAHEPGIYSLIWDGRDDGNAVTAAGVYYVRLTTDRGQFSRRIVCIR